MPTIWENGGLVIESGGKVIECDDCPCLECGECLSNPSTCTVEISGITRGVFYEPLYGDDDCVLNWFNSIHANIPIAAGAGPGTGCGYDKQSADQPCDPVLDPEWLALRADIFNSGFAARVQLIIKAHLNNFGIIEESFSRVWSLPGDPRPADCTTIIDEPMTAIVPSNIVLDVSAALCDITFNA